MVGENPDAEEVALTKRSERVIERVAPFKTRGANLGCDDTSSRAEFGVSKVDWEFSKVSADVVVNLDVEGGEMETGMDVSIMADDDMSSLTADTLSKDELFDVLGASREVPEVS